MVSAKNFYAICLTAAAIALSTQEIAAKKYGYGGGNAVADQYGNHGANNYDKYDGKKDDKYKVDKYDGKKDDKYKDDKYDGKKDNKYDNKKDDKYDGKKSYGKYLRA